MQELDMRTIKQFLSDAKRTSISIQPQVVKEVRRLRAQLHGKDYRPSTNYRLSAPLGGDVTTLLKQVPIQVEISENSIPLNGIEDSQGFALSEGLGRGAPGISGH